MRLTSAQLATLRSDIIADSSLNSLPKHEEYYIQIADTYNQLASPDFWVWRTKVSREELLFAVSVDGTTFDFSGAGYLTRTVQELELFESLFDINTGFANPSLAQVRAAVSAALSGATAPAPANRTHLVTVSRRKATRVEKLFATGTGSTGSPATMAFEGPLDPSDVDIARAN